MPHCPLYTKGVTGRRRELRVHVAFGQVILSQQKRRRDGYQEMPEYSNLVRNYDTGWIYATSTVVMSDSTRDLALNSVSALGLDFGAVDIITQGDSAWVLEVNTAPGLQGESSRAAYATAFSDYFNGETAFHLATERIPQGQPGSTTMDEMREQTPLMSLGEVFGTPSRSERGIRRPSDDQVPSESLRVSDENAEVPASRVRPSWSFPADAVMRSDDFTSDGTGDTTTTAPRPISPSMTRLMQEMEAHTVTPSDSVSVPNPWDQMELDSEFNSTSRTNIAEPEVRQPQPAPNPMSSTATPPATPVTTAMPFDGEGHYVVEMAPEVRTVVYVAPDGTIYTSEHDLVLQEEAVSVITKIAV
jgi:hypothetical protein